MSLVVEKTRQAVEILHELGVPLWLTFVRETGQIQDPVLPLIGGPMVVWQSAFLISAGGERIAIVGVHDVENIERLGAYSQVIGYVESIRPPLRETLQRLDPSSIAINYSPNDVAADGLTHGMNLLLRAILEDTPYLERLQPAERVIAALRGRKLPGEVERIRQAIQLTDQLFEYTGMILRPGLSEKEIAALIHAEMDRNGLRPAWERELCPIIDAGPKPLIGHGGPGDLRLERGQLLHMDVGVFYDGYCSDLQRVWYLQRYGERELPAEVRRGFQAVVGAIRAAADVLVPGVPGHEVDAVARRYLVEAGFPEYQHALGHHLGRSVHDGAGVLGPRWERYGETPNYPVEENNVFTLELEVKVEPHGWVSLEEDVLVTKNGCEFLSKPQVDPIVV